MSIRTRRKEDQVVTSETKIEPSEPKPTTVKKTNSISLITTKAFSQDVKKGAPFVILATKKITKESNTAIPSEVTLVIVEFADVFLEDFSEKLPPMCDMQYAIDLVPELVFSTCPTIG